MGPRGKAPPARPGSRAGTAKVRGGKRPPPPAELAPDILTARAMEGNTEAFLALVRFHSTFDPMPLSPGLLRKSEIGEAALARLLPRLKRKEDGLLRPFPSVDMMFWGEAWVQEALGRLMWKRRGGRSVPNEAFIRRLWDASREGAALQLKIYRKAGVTPAAWVRVKAPHFANLGLSDVQMLRIARAEGCRFDEEPFLRAVRRFRRDAGL